MNINEEMGQLGQIGSTGYHASDTVVDHLVTKTKRARAFRQGSAALVGSLGAVVLGLIGAQVFVNLTQDQDAGKIPIRDLAFNNKTFEELEGKGYTGLGKSPEELAAAWKKVQDGAKIVPAAPAPATTTPPVTETPKPVTCEYTTKEADGWIWYKSTDTGCSWTKKEPVEPYDLPTGWLEFGGYEAECTWYTDAATGSTYFAARINSGSWIKMVQCTGDDPDNYGVGAYRHIEGRATVEGTTCTGQEKWKYEALHRFSCNPNMNDPRTGEYFLIDPANYKWFSPSGRYYCISTPPEGWYWTGTEWAEVLPEPSPSPTGPTV